MVFLKAKNLQLNSLQMTRQFSTVYDTNMSADQLDKDLKKNSEWAYEWKMIFNPDLSKQHKKLYFPEKLTR